MKINQSAKCSRLFSPIIISAPLSQRTQKKKFIRKVRPNKLTPKSYQQISILVDFYSNNKNNWSRRDIRTLSLKTSLPFQKVYKYLWNKRNRERKNRCTQSNPQSNINITENKQVTQANPQLQAKPRTIPMRQIEAKNVILQLPENVMFASQFYLLQSQQVPAQAIKMLIEGGFSLILDKV